MPWSQVSLPASAPGSANQTDFLLAIAWRCRVKQIENFYCVFADEWLETIPGCIIWTTHLKKVCASFAESGSAFERATRGFGFSDRFLNQSCVGRCDAPRASRCYCWLLRATSFVVSKTVYLFGQCARERTNSSAGTLLPVLFSWLQFQILPI